MKKKRRRKLIRKRRMRLRNGATASKFTLQSRLEDPKT